MPNAHKTQWALREMLDLLAEGKWNHYTNSDGVSRPLIELGSGAPSGDGGPTRGLIYVNTAATANNAAVYIAAGTSTYTSVV